MIKLSQILLKIGQFIKESKVNYAKEASCLNGSYWDGNINLLEYAKKCPAGITYVITGEPTTGIPSDAHYCAGMVLRRTTDQINVVLFSYGTTSCFIYINTLLGTTWSGWKKTYLS